MSSAHALEKAATSTADVEFLLVSDALNDASLWSTLEALRVHPKTARLPIGILARPGHAERRGAHCRGSCAACWCWSEKVDDATLDLQLPQLLALADRDAIAPARRDCSKPRPPSGCSIAWSVADPPAELDLVVARPGGWWTR